MSKKFRIIKCSTSSKTWYEVERKGLLFWNKEEKIIASYPFIIAYFPIYGIITFKDLEEARKYILDRLPAKKQDKRRIVRIVYDIIESK